MLISEYTNKRKIFIEKIINTITIYKTLDDIKSNEFTIFLYNFFTNFILHNTMQIRDIEIFVTNAPFTSETK